MLYASCTHSTASYHHTWKPLAVQLVHYCINNLWFAAIDDDLGACDAERSCCCFANACSTTCDQHKLATEAKHAHEIRHSSASLIAAINFEFSSALLLH
jgi:hypothetical protein